MDDSKKTTRPQDGKKHKVCQEDIMRLEKERDEYKAKYLRALADYQNFERRTKEEKEELRKTAYKDCILSFLPFLDNLDTAGIFIKDSGLKIIREDFYTLLKKEGLEETELLGKAFDPHKAEAVEVVHGSEDNIVTEIVRKGYIYNGKVVRVAQVKVSKKNKDENAY